MAAARIAFRICSLTAALGLATGALLVSPAPVQAQGLFDLLLGALRGAAPRAYNREAPSLLDGFPEQYAEENLSGPGGPYVAYCVRLCDGRYFPLPHNAGSPSANPQKVCSAMCPAAQTKVFSGTQIERAVATDGKRYSTIENAFAYREKLSANCSCDGRDTSGTASMDAESDPTLRPGDIVVTAEGPKVYKGDRRTPHTVSDFVPAEKYNGLPKRLRQSVAEMRVSPERLSATVKTGMSQPETAAVKAPETAPALSMAPDGGDAMGEVKPGTPN